MNLFVGALLIIGKILLVILAVLTALLLMILLVPVRYQLRAEKEGAAMEASAHAAWLLRAIQVKFLIRKNDSGGDRNMDILLFGFSLADLKKKRKHREAAARHARKKKRLASMKKENPERYEQLKAEAAERKKEKEERIREKESAEHEGKENEPEKSSDSESQLKEEEKGAVYLLRKWLIRVLVKIKRFLRKPVRILKKSAVNVILRAEKLMSDISQKVRCILGGLSDKYAVLRKYAAFLSDERTKEAFRKLLKLLRSLLIHIRPKVLEGEAVIGFDDPALTGEVAGLAFAFAGVSGGNVKITPDFQEKHLDGRIYAGGRVILGRLALLVLAGALDRNVRFVIGFFKNNT